jgi:uncharacterized protein
LISKGLHIALFIVSTQLLYAQEKVRMTYHDVEQKHVKEIYHVKSNQANILEGPYTSYFLNGKVESKGQFTNNTTTGLWEFFFESGALKMRGTLRQNYNYGIWEYYYENGNKSMEGNIINRKREGEWKLFYESSELREIGNYEDDKREGAWKFFYENGKTKADVIYLSDEGEMREYYPSGRLKAKGMVISNKKSGFWQYFDEDTEFLQASGNYADGKKTGRWQTFYASGKVSLEGPYVSDQPSGEWLYYFEDGGLSMRGNYLGGQKEGTWYAYYVGGTKKSETKFNKGTGEYNEYYKSGKLKVSGHIFEGKNEGRWEYYYESGNIEGICDFSRGRGYYIGYYEDGVIQTRGWIEDDKKIETWEIYDRQGKLTGYYKPFYENLPAGREVKVREAKASNNKTGFRYFNPKSSEFRGVILSTNPFASLYGYLPVGIEFFNNERLGHEFEFVSIRNPFFVSDMDVPLDNVFSRGYDIALKQKFYNSRGKAQWYFGHEIRLVNLSHFSNITLSQFPNTKITASATEQRAEYGLLLGLRIFQKTKKSGFTADVFTAYNIGYRGFLVDEIFIPYFRDIEQRRLASSFRVGLNFGYLLSSEYNRR